MSPTSDPAPSPIHTSDGVVSVTREGDPAGPAVICTHGIPGTVRDFRYLAPELTARGFHVVRVDTPGFGDSPRGGLRSVEGWARRLHSVAEALALPRYLLLGHSFGGGAAIHAAAGGGGPVAGLVLISAPGPRRHRGYFMPHWGYGAIGSLVALPLLRQPVAALGRFAYGKLGLRPPARGDWRSLRHQARIVSSLRFERLAALVGRLSCPTLVCHCIDDPLVEVAIARENVALIPDGEALLFDDGGHYPQKHHAAAIAAAMAARFAEQGVIEKRTEGDGER